MAYETLHSLLKELDRVLDHQNINCFIQSNKRRYRSNSSFLCISCFSSSNGDWRCGNCFILQNKLEILSLHEKVVFLSQFIEDFRGEAASLEAGLTNAAKQGREALYFYRCSSSENDFKWEELRQELEKSINEIDSIYQEAKGIKDSNKNPSMLPRVDPIGKQSTVGLEESIKEIDSFYQETQEIKSSNINRSFLPRVAPIDIETTVGLEEYLIEIKGRLCGEPSELEIIPIIGMGGIGKTTLARYAYQDPSNIHHFDVCAWATVSQNSSAEIILSSLLSSMTQSNKEYKYMNKELLVVNGHRYLKKRRYLIVMDDMWDTNVWDDVRMAFPDDCNGSRIIITTRNSDIASYVDSSNHHHKIQLLSADQSWRLLKVKVFGHENCPPELENIGKHISEKCKGLPLAIVVIAGLLSKLERKQDSWEKIARNVSEAVNSSSDALSVSYMHLPPHLRHCFLYTACFPEDYEIDVWTLIILWLAEGFLISDESKDMEELGYEYLEDLDRRSLVLIEKKSYDGKIKTVKIHDVLRDLCIRKIRDENFFCIINEFQGSFAKGIENSNRLSICSNIFSVIPNMESSPIRTILLFKHWAFDFFKSYKLLRVVHGLKLSSGAKSSIRFIGELIHLRYLSFTCEPVERTLRFVSECLYQLQNLQTLIVTLGRFFYIMDSATNQDLYQRCMAFEIWRMPQLRHVILLDGFIPHPFPEQISALDNLHVLARISDFKCSERFLQMIPNLKKLGIIYSYKVIYERGWSEYSLMNLVHLYKLEKLSIYTSPYPNMKNEWLSNNISCPLSLKKLNLNGCRFPWEDMLMIGSLPNLQVLKLINRACVGTVWETNEGEFCQLKVLVIDSTDLHEWIADASAFSSLERLTLYECWSLREIPNVIGDIPTLELIEVDIRDSSVVASAKCIEEEQQSLGNDEMQVRLLKSRSWKFSSD